MGRRALGMTPEASISLGVDLMADAFPAIRSQSAREVLNATGLRWPEPEVPAQ